MYIPLIPERPARSPNKKESTMLRPSTWVKVLIALSVLAVTFLLGTAAAQKAAVPKPQDRLALGEESVKQLLLLMETDTRGNVSKQTYMQFMESEFHRLDKSNAGQLNAHQLLQPTISPARFTGK
jgi:hypothetical protein